MIGLRGHSSHRNYKEPLKGLLDQWGPTFWQVCHKLSLHLPQVPLRSPSLPSAPYPICFCFLSPPQSAMCHTWRLLLPLVTHMLQVGHTCSTPFNPVPCIHRQPFIHSEEEKNTPKIICFRLLHITAARHKTRNTL